MTDTPKLDLAAIERAEKALARWLESENPKMKYLECRERRACWQEQLNAIGPELLRGCRSYLELKAAWYGPGGESDWLEFCQDFDWEPTR